MAKKRKLTRSYKLGKFENEEITEEEQPAAEAPPLDLSQFLLMNDVNPEPAKLRLIGLYGEVNEDRAAETAFSLMALKAMGRRETKLNPDEPECDKTEVTYDPIDFVVSTWGGSAADMFSIYDTMRGVREDCEIKTIGLGKVMSAGVLLLAAGTKGSRQIGQNCRLMLHGVTSGQHGNLTDLENEMAEAQWTQDRLVHCLSKESNMTKRYIKKLLDKRMNVYLTAEEAVDLGIADEII